jgi:hypothetical protein
MRLVPSPPFASLALVLAIASLTAACGDDGSTDTGAETGPAASTSAGSSSTSTSTSAGSSSEGGSSTGADDLDSTGSTAAASSDDGTTTGGPAGDPSYHPPNGGSCPDGTLPVTLPGAQLCAPFCDGADDMCPAAATGDAPPECRPFAGMGGSGDACDDVTPCADDETCSGGSCADIAFFACQLLCTMGETCPDGMACSGIGTCGYP